MKKILILVVLTLQLAGFAQELPFKKVTFTDTKALASQMKELAVACDQKKLSEFDLFKFQLISGAYKEAKATIEKSIRETPREESIYLDMYQVYLKAVLSSNFEESFKQLYKTYLMSSNDFEVLNIDDTMISRDATDYFVADFKNNYERISTETISMEVAQNLVKKYFFNLVYGATRDLFIEEIKQDHKRRYDINDRILLPTKDGGEISMVVIQRKGTEFTKKPATLIASIYAGINEVGAMLSASKGYVGVIMNTRGKRRSRDEVKPFEYENTDIYEAIDWISKQSWSNGKVGMYGGSYDGFGQWASMKHKVHPALRTIVPMVAIAPGIDYPMENNVLQNYSYSWYFHVSNNKFLDIEVYNDYNRWENLKNKWYSSGAAFNKLDSIDGTVNKLWNAYMKHPSYDDYWKKMIPYKQEFSKINIPILTITGYYDDSQRGAMYYYNQHHKYVKNPNHYLLVGPYDHWTSQNKPAAYLRNYKLDKAALINIRYDLVYEWFDYILKGKEKPSILKDKVNFQVMGANTWMHKPSISAMTNDTLQFYLSADKKGDFYTLKSAANKTTIDLSVDFKDRNSMTNNEYYPWPLERQTIDLNDGLIFKSEVLKEDVILNGSFLGNLEFAINKKDVDYSVILYQLTPAGTYYHLSYYIGRASFAKDREHRQLLTPNQNTKVAFDNSKLISKKLEKGSRIIVVVNVNKNNNAQLNYGTGKDVNIETIKDAKTPLTITFTGNSSISLPVWK